jgi:hypothetical protein
LRAVAKLWHYTGPEGLVGIATGSELWTTDIRYLNDAEEYTYAAAIANRVIDRFARARPGLSKVLDALAGMTYVLKPKHVSTLVCAFSEVADSLDQWRGYCPPAAGYALGFSRKRLARLAKSQRYRLLPCVYDGRAQHIMFSQILRGHLNDYPQLVASQGERAAGRALLENFGESYSAWAPFIKNPSFSAEREWRLVSDAYEVTSAVDRERLKIRYRAKGRIPVPYGRFSLQSASRRDRPLVEVVIGPTPEYEIAEASVEHLLRGIDMGGKVRIVRSKVPFRLT